RSEDQPVALPQSGARVSSTVDRWSPPALLAVAALGWWWSVHSAQAMSSGMGAAMSGAAFLGAWVAMMAAMMLPAVLPVVRLSSRAAARGTVAPVAFFLAGYC